MTPSRSLATELRFDAFTEPGWRTGDAVAVRVPMVGLVWRPPEPAIPPVGASESKETNVIAESSSERAEVAVAHADSIKNGPDYREVHWGPSADATDAVYVRTPNVADVEFLEPAAQLGTDVLCEKPTNGPVESADRNVALTVEHDVSVMVASPMQAEPAVRRARADFASGPFGEPVDVHGTVLKTAVGFTTEESFSSLVST